MPRCLLPYSVLLSSSFTSLLTPVRSLSLTLPCALTSICSPYLPSSKRYFLHFDLSYHINNIRFVQVKAQVLPANVSRVSDLISFDSSPLPDGFEEEPDQDNLLEDDLPIFEIHEGDTVPPIYPINYIDATMFPINAIHYEVLKRVRCLPSELANSIKYRLKTPLRHYDIKISRNSPKIPVFHCLPPYLYIMSVPCDRTVKSDIGCLVFATDRSEDDGWTEVANCLLCWLDDANCEWTRKGVPYGLEIKFDEYVEGSGKPEEGINYRFIPSGGSSKRTRRQKQNAASFRAKSTTAVLGVEGSSGKGRGAARRATHPVGVSFNDLGGSIGPNDRKRKRDASVPKHGEEADDDSSTLSSLSSINSDPDLETITPKRPFKPVAGHNICTSSRSDKQHQQQCKTRGSRPTIPQSLPSSIRSKPPTLKNVTNERAREDEDNHLPGLSTGTQTVYGGTTIVDPTSSETSRLIAELRRDLEFQTKRADNLEKHLTRAQIEVARKLFGTEEDHVDIVRRRASELVIAQGIDITIAVDPDAESNLDDLPAEGAALTALVTITNNDNSFRMIGRGSYAVYDRDYILSRTSLPGRIMHHNTHVYDPITGPCDKPRPPTFRPIPILPLPQHPHSTIPELGTTGRTADTRAGWIVPALRDAYQRGGATDPFFKQLVERYGYEDIVQYIDM